MAVFPLYEEIWGDSCVQQVKELNHYLETEKSCRTDLEMYVAVLNTQKSVLQEDAEKLRKELHEGNRNNSYCIKIYELWRNMYSYQVWLLLKEV